MIVGLFIGTIIGFTLANLMRIAKESDSYKIYEIERGYTE